MFDIFYHDSGNIIFLSFKKHQIISITVKKLSLEYDGDLITAKDYSVIIRGLPRNTKIEGVNQKDEIKKMFESDKMLIAHCRLANFKQMSKLENKDAVENGN